MDLESELGRRLNRKNPPKVLPPIIRAVGSFAIEPPERFTTRDVSDRTPRNLEFPYGVSMNQVAQTMPYLYRLELVQLMPEGYPFNSNARGSIFTCVNEAAWSEVTAVLNQLRPLPEPSGPTQ